MPTAKNITFQLLLLLTIVILNTKKKKKSQEYKRYGVHVCLVIIDGTVDAPGIRTLFDSGNGKRRSQARLCELESPGSKFLRPGDAGDAYVYLAEQPRSVWTHELTLTPNDVKIGMRL